MIRGAWVVARKELRETLRDWRTLLMMVGVPVLLYPALLALGNQLTILGIRRVTSETVRLAVAGPGDSDELRELLGRNELVQLRELGEFGSGDADESIQAGAVAVRNRELEAVAVVTDSPEPLGTAAVTLLYDETRDRSRHGRDVLRRAVLAWNDTLLARRLEDLALPGEFAKPITVADSSLASSDERGGYLLGRILPAVLIMITLFGAFYPALDLAAGEKERGTLETLLTAPVAPLAVVLGKFTTVAAIAIVAAALNLASMLLTFRTGLFQLPGAGLDFTLPLAAFLWVGLLLALLAATFSALCLGIAVRCQSFKEAQNALTPVLMLVMLPAFIAVVPGVEFSVALALIPVAGPGLLFRDLMAGDANVGQALLVVIATAAYAAGALAFAADAFGRENVLFGSGPAEAPGGKQRLGELMREWRAGGGTPGPGLALLFLLAVAALNLVLAPRFAMWFGIEGGLLASQWLLMLLPAVAFVALFGFDLRRTLSLYRPSRRQLFGALLVIAGGTPLAWFLAWLQSTVMPIPDELVEALRRLVTADSPGRLLWLLLVAAITPALCEEFLFRGVLLGSSRGRMSAARAIAMNAAIFGIFHLSFVRLLPTTWLGLLLAWVVWRTRSIWTSVLMHSLNNGLVVVLAALPLTRDWNTETGGDAPALILAPVGLALLVWGIRVLRAEPPAGPTDVALDEHVGGAPPAPGDDLGGSPGEERGTS